MTIPFPVPLACPRCRVQGAAGGPVVSRLAEEAEAGATYDACPRCGARSARVDGIRCVPPDLEAFLAAQADDLPPAGPSFAPEEAGALCARALALEPESDAFREATFAAPYALAHFPGSAGPLEEGLSGNRATFGTLAGWLARHAEPVAGAAPCLLEAGCGPGAFLHVAAPLFPAGALGLDLRIGVLRLARRLADRGEAGVAFRVEGRRIEPVRISLPPSARAPADAIHLVQGDVLDPPFEPESFPAVAALSLLDTVPDPLVALGQLDALLAPGGLLLLASPWSWEAGITPPGAWWSGPGATAGEVLRALLAGRHPALPHLRYELLEEADRLPWALPGHGRLLHRFFLEAVLARKAR
jgi:SAM-dependent methyltransferase